jgi:hypothetical protein
MNPDSHDLIQRHMAGLLTDDEAAVLQTRLKADTDLRRLYLHYMNLDVALEAQAGSRDRVIDLLRAAPLTQHKPAGRWFSWRSLTAAAAGIVFGMLCTSVVFGFVGHHGVQKTPLAVLQPSFEDAQMPLARGFPPVASLWTGDVSKVVPAENGVTPKDGHHMVRLETNVHGKSVLFPRLYQIIPLPPSGSALREIEVSASFTSADPDSSPHYTVRAYAVNEAPQRLGPDWFARHWFIQRDESIASAETGFENPPGNAKWQSIGLRMQVPGKARCLVVFFGVKNQAKSQAKKPHYLDAVQVSFVESPSIP